MSARALLSVFGFVLGCSDGGTLVLPNGAAAGAPASDAGAMVAAGGTGVEASAPDVGEAGDSAAGATSALGAQCKAVTTDQPGPHSAQFLFLNTSGRELFLSLKCELNFSVRSCADGYAEALVTQYPPGSAPCSADSACSVVPCVESAPKLAPSGSIQAEWSGRAFSLEPQNDCSCFEPLPDAKPGIYRVEIPVFDSAAALAKSAAPLFVAQAEFELPRPGDAPVEVHLQSP